MLLTIYQKRNIFSIGLLLLLLLLLLLFMSLFIICLWGFAAVSRFLRDLGMRYLFIDC